MKAMVKSMKKTVVCKDIIKSFGNGNEAQTVLNSVSVEIDEGEFVAVMGASGSGKFTLLYALSGMDCVDSGEIMFDGEDISSFDDTRLSDIRREKMGFVFQQPTLLKNLNLLDNIILPRIRNHRKDVKQITEKAKSLMEQVGIANLAERDITQVSGGQLQRAGISRSLINDPKILFADEPTGALNSMSSDGIMDVFSAIHENGTAILLVTHDVKVAARAQRVLFMQDGKIVSQIALDTASGSDLAAKTEKILLETKQLGI